MCACINILYLYTCNTLDYSLLLILTFSEQTWKEKEKINQKLESNI